MTRLQLTLFLLALSTAACARYPEPYRPPQQRRPQGAGSAVGLAHAITMSAPGAENHFVSGVLPELHDNSWRWTLRHPVFRFQVPSTENLSLEADLTVPDVTFKQTGPVRITVWVEAHRLDVIEINKDQRLQYRKPVPASWLTTARPVEVAFDIDKLWRSGQETRGFILTSLGFVE